jgi:uncharacterized cupredoxin-like copper-binding protein
VRAVLIAALSTTQKIGLGLCVLAFAGFSLIVSMVVPRYRPDFPGRGLRVFLVACALLFVGMVSAVVFVARETSEAEAGNGTTEAQTTTQTQTSTTGTTTQSTTATAAPKTVQVSEVEFKITVPSTTLKAGSYTFEVKNDGHIAHDLVVKGPGVNAKTPTFNPGQTESLEVDLKPGTYDVYCSIPGHKEAGMDVKLTVT